VELIMRLVEDRMRAALARTIEREQAWLPHDRRGRWVVIESGAGHYLTGEPRHIRQIADRYSKRRARRFSSLSAARAFAKSVDGTVRRWRRTPPGGGVWRRESLWEHAREGCEAALRLPALLWGSR
jgi:hypothetical protein